ncbi:polyprenol monophosphomannose synthase [Candidatus Woesearchaeota archaeon]|nr:polyprenol monophosphomannose synthase [Candidatus Woesearchaeota archaeon]
MKPFVMIPTYNERENIGNLIDKILKLRIKNLRIVVADDNSPDGTWRIVRDISKKNKNVRLLLRKKDRGRGSAGRDGFIYCLNHDADVVVEMDADFSHDPKYIPLMLKELKTADLVLGSRRVEGSKEIGRIWLRKFVTFGANLYIRLMLGLKVRDCNSGFRCFRREVLEKINLEKLESKGPAIVQEVLFKAHLKGFKIKEIPITFVDRTKGRSKLGIPQLAAGYFMVLRLKFLKLIGGI